MSRRSSWSRSVARAELSLALLALGAAGLGCALVRPLTVTPPAAPPSYVLPARTELPASLSPGSNATTGETSSRERTAAAPATAPGGTWWAAFADPALDAAIGEALRNNYTIRDLRTLIYEGQRDPAIPRGLLWPLQVSVPAFVQRTTLATPPSPGFSASSNTFTEAEVGVAASYQVDVWGQLDMQRRVFEDVIEQQRQNTEVFAQTLAEQVAQLWFDILEQRALRRLLEDQVRYNRELLAIVHARFEQQLVTRLAVLQQEQQLSSTEALLPLSQAQLALSNSKLTALLGRLPTPEDDLVPEQRSLPDLPPAPPLGSPVDLIQNSPELRLAHARVAEVEHQVSENLSSWLPAIDVFGNAAVRSFNFDERFVTSAVGVRLTWPLFDGARRITEAEQLELRLQRRNWQYELALNTAVQRVQEALIQEQRQADNLRALRAQVELGRRVLFEARYFFEQGQSDYLPVLTALTSLSNLERAALQAQRLLLGYRVQLYRALGGGWSRSATLPRPAALSERPAAPANEGDFP